MSGVQIGPKAREEYVHTYCSNVHAVHGYFFRAFQAIRARSGNNMIDSCMDGRTTPVTPL